MTSHRWIFLENYLIHPTNSPNPHPWLCLHSSFTPSLKYCSPTNPILIHPLIPTSIPVSTPNTLYHSRLTVCLLDSLNLTRCLSILFWTRACEYSGSQHFAFVGAVEISSVRLRIEIFQRPIMEIFEGIIIESYLRIY